MEVNSPLYNLEFIGESMEQKDRGSHCCTGECFVLNLVVSFSHRYELALVFHFSLLKGRLQSLSREIKYSSVTAFEFIESRYYIKYSIDNSVISPQRFFCIALRD